MCVYVFILSQWHLLSVCNLSNVYVYYTVILVPSNTLRSYHRNLNQWCPLHVIYASARLNCVVSSTAIWWRSVELQYGNVKGLTFLKYIHDYFHDKIHTKNNAATNSKSSLYIYRKFMTGQTSILTVSSGRPSNGIS